MRTAPLSTPARRTPLAVDTAVPAGGEGAAEAASGAGAGAPAVPNSDVSKSMTNAGLASDAPPAVACTRFSGGAPAGVAVACAVWVVYWFKGRVGCSLAQRLGIWTTTLICLHQVQRRRAGRRRGRLRQVRCLLV